MYVCLAAKVTTGRGVLEHTYLDVPKCDENAKGLTGRRVLDQLCKKPSQGGWFWNAYLQNAADCDVGMYVSKVLCLWRVFQNSSPCEGFCKHDSQLAWLSWPKPLCLWWFLQFQASWTLLGGALLCMYVWKPSACHGKRNIHARTWTWELTLNYRKSKKTRPLSRIRLVEL